MHIKDSGYQIDLMYKEWRLLDSRQSCTCSIWFINTKLREQDTPMKADKELKKTW